MAILFGIFSKDFNWKVVLQFVACIVATLSTFGDGQNNMWPSPILPKLLANDSSIPTTNLEGAWIASLYLGAEPIGAVTGIYVMKKFGAKYTALLSSIPNCVSFLLLAFATSTIPLYISRIIGCFGDAFIFIGVSAYIGEIAEPQYRGGLSTLLMVIFFIGCIYTYYFGYVLSIETFAIVGCVCVVVQALCFVLMPQSPTFLIRNGKIEEAKKILRKLRKNVFIVDKEIEEIKSIVETEKKSSFMDLFFDPVNRKAMFIIILTVLVWQFSGGTTMSLYLHVIVQEAQLQFNDLIPITLYGVVQTLSCLGSTFLVDRIGRKILLLVSCGGSILSLIVMGGYFYIKTKGNYDVINVTWLPVVALLLFIFFNNIGLASVGVVYTSEVFAYNMQSYGGAVLCASYGIFGLSTNMAFEIITDEIGMYGIFWLFAGLTLIGTIVIYYYVPETKNKSLLEIQEMLQGTNPYKIKHKNTYNLEVTKF